MSLAFLVIPFIGDVWLLYLTQAIGGFGRGLTMPLLMGLSIKHFPGEKRATAMGIFQATYGLGMVFGPVMAGFLASKFGLAWGFWVTGFAGIAGACQSGWRGFLSWQPGRINQKQ